MVPAPILYPKRPRNLPQSPTEDLVFQQRTSQAEPTEKIGRGWRPQAGPGLADNISISRMPRTGRELFGREKELKILDDCWSDPSIYVVGLIAWGGVGKSALMNHWLRAMGEDQYRGAERVYAWSFYRQGTT